MREFCTASDKEFTEELQKVDAIFSGEVISIGERIINQDEFKFGSQILRIKVLRVWKGVETPEVSLLYTRAYTTFEEEIGGIRTKKVFYAYKSADDSNLHIDYCSFTAFDNERMKREYGEGKNIEQSPDKQLQQEENIGSFWSNLWKKITSFFS